MKPEKILNGKGGRPTPRQKRELREAARKRERTKLVIGGIIVLLAVGAVSAYGVLKEEERLIHDHANVVVYVNGEKVAFNAPAFDMQSTQYMRAHLHLPNDMKVHLEGKPHVTLNHIVERAFLSLLHHDGLELSDAASISGKFKNNETHTLKVFAKHQDGEWFPVEGFEKYEPQDLDRVLVTYGNESEEEIRRQQERIPQLQADEAPPPEHQVP